MLVGIGRFIVGFVVPMQRLDGVLYWYIADDGCWQDNITVVWDQYYH
jgi:hypothetical protein